MNAEAWIGELEREEAELDEAIAAAQLTITAATNRKDAVAEAKACLLPLLPERELPPDPPAAMPAKVTKGKPREPNLSTAARSDITPARVLEVMGELGGGDWLSAGRLGITLATSRKTITDRIQTLLADNRIEKRGTGAGTRYRPMAPLNQPPLPAVGAPAAAASPKPAAAPREPPSLRPEGHALRVKIEKVLRDSRPRTVKELSDNLVIPKHDIEAELAILMETGEQNLGPAVTKRGGRDTVATYEIQPHEVALWPFDES